jgi:hypothetical protein
MEYGVDASCLKLADVLCSALGVIEVGQEQLLLPLRVARPSQLSLQLVSFTTWVAVLWIMVLANLLIICRKVILPKTKKLYN